MPFTNVGCVIALFFQNLSDRNLRRLQALRRIRQSGLCQFIIELIRRQAVIQTVANHRHHRSHAGGRWRKFKSCSSRIPTRHQHPARRRAGRIAGVRLLKHGPFGGELIDRMGLDCALCNTATKCRDIVVTHVIGQDEYDIWRALIQISNGRIRTFLPR